MHSSFLCEQHVLTFGDTCPCAVQTPLPFLQVGSNLAHGTITNRQGQMVVLPRHGLLGAVVDVRIYAWHPAFVLAGHLTALLPSTPVLLELGRYAGWLVGTRLLLRITSLSAATTIEVGAGGVPEAALVVLLMPTDTRTEAAVGTFQRPLVWWAHWCIRCVDQSWRRMLLS